MTPYILLGGKKLPPESAPAPEHSLRRRAPAWIDTELRRTNWFPHCADAFPFKVVAVLEKAAVEFLDSGQPGVRMRAPKGTA
jgi:hypothetical protein